MLRARRRDRPRWGGGGDLADLGARPVSALDERLPGKHDPLAELADLADLQFAQLVDRRAHLCAVEALYRHGASAQRLENGQDRLLAGARTAGGGAGGFWREWGRVRWLV